MSFRAALLRFSPDSALTVALTVALPLALTVALPLALAAPVLAQATATAPAAEASAESTPEAPAAPLPRVLVVATGGTIAGTGYASVEKALDANALVEAVPALAEVARLSLEDPFTVPSSQLTPEMLQTLALRVRQALAADAELAGIVVTVGTDSLEEVALFLDLTLDLERPIVVTGAMRPPSTWDADGARNLLAAVRVAAAQGTRGLGVLVVLNDEIHAAREVRKTLSTAVQAFASPAGGPIGFLDGARIFLRSRPLRRVTKPAETIEPKVDLITITVGSDGHLVRAAVEAGARGLVLEAFGRGNVPRTVIPEIIKARQQGVAVVFASRTRAGALNLDPRWTGAGIVFAEDLDGVSARIALMVALGTLAEPADLQAYFDRLAGLI